MGLFDDVLGGGSEAASVSNGSGGLFDDVLKPKKQNQGILGELGSSLKRGVDSTIDYGKIGLTDNTDEIAGIVSDNLRNQPQPSAARQKMDAEIKPYAQEAADAQGITENIGAYGKLIGKRAVQLVSNPREFAGMVAENLPNSAPGIAGMVAGGYAGAPLGIVGAGVGAFAGGALGGYKIEQGSAMFDQIVKEAQARGIDTNDKAALSQMVSEKYPEFLKASQLKGIGTAGTDAALNVATLGIVGTGERILAKEARNVADLAKAGAITGEEAASSLAAIEAKNAARNTLGQKVIRGAGVTAGEMAGESASEAVGQQMAYGKLDPLDVIDEGLLAFGQGVGMAAGRKFISPLVGATEKDTIAQEIDRARAFAAALNESVGGDANAVPTLITDLAPIQQRIDALHGIGSTPIGDNERTQYARELEAAFGEVVGYTNDKNGLEIPFTMGDYLDSKVRSSDITRDRPKAEAANIASTNRIDSLADEETNGYVAPEIPVVGPLSAAANLAVQSGAHEQTQMQQAMQAAVAKQNTSTEGQSSTPAVAQPTTTAPASGTLAGIAAMAPSIAPVAPNIAAQAPNIGGQTNAASPAQVAKEAPQADAPKARATAAQATSQGQGIDLSNRTHAQLNYLTQHGKNGHKEAAIAELQRRGKIAAPKASAVSESVPALKAEDSADRPNGDGYEQRNASRVSRINKANTQEEFDAITAEEHSDGERHFEGTERVRSTINDRKFALKIEAAKNVEASRYEAGDWVSVSEHGSRSAAEQEAKDLQRKDPSSEYRLSIGQNDGWSVRKRKKPDATVSKTETVSEQAPIKKTDTEPSATDNPANRIRTIDKWTAKELQDRLDRGNLTPESEQRLRAELAKRPQPKQSTPQESPLMIGKTPHLAEPVTVRNGVVWVGEYPAIDYDTEADITVPDGATPQQIIDSLRHGGALGSRKVFGLKSDSAQTEAQPPSASPQHVENGKAESATAAVVVESLKKGAANSPLDLRQERDLLLQKVDQAIAAAPTAEEKDAWDSVNQKIDLTNNMHVADTIGYRVFDVPGDGKFKVLNLKEALQRFRERVEASPGFKKPSNSTGLQTVAPWQRTTTGGTEATTKELLDAGEYSAAVEYAKQIGKPLVFGQYQDGSSVTVYTDSKPFEHDGYDDFKMVSARNPGAADKVAWSVIDLNSGLTISSQHPTRLKVIAETHKALDKMTPEQLATAVRSARASGGAYHVGTQGELEQRWLDKVDVREAEAQARADQEHRKGLRSHRGMIADHTGKPAEEAGKPAAPAVDNQKTDYKGFERVPLGNGAFELRDGNMTVRVEPATKGKYQASFRSAKSSPHLIGEQGAVDWAASYRSDATTKAPVAKAADAKREEFIHNGVRIYPANVNVGGEAKAMWGVESFENKAKREAGERYGFGDGLVETEDQAKSAADRLIKDEKAKEEAGAKRKYADEEAARKKAEIDADTFNGFLDDKAPNVKALIRERMAKQWRFDGGKIMTARERVESLWKSGELAVSTYEENKIKPMSRTQFNRATQREQDAHEKKVRDGGKVTVYLVNESDLGKTAYDYARHLIDSKGNGVANPPKTPQNLSTSPEPVKETAKNEQDEPAEDGKPANKADEAKPSGTADAGEELTYNKRNRRTGGIKWDDIKDKNAALRVKEVVKAKVYPKPDYQALVDGGMRDVVAHIVKQAYDSIAPSPKLKRGAEPTDEALQSYIAGVNRVMDGVMKWANDSAAVAKWAEKQSRSGSISVSELAAASSLLDTVYPEGWKTHRDELIMLGGNKLLSKLQPGYDEVGRAMKDIKLGWPAKSEAWQKQGYKVVNAETVDVELYSSPQRDKRAAYVSGTVTAGNQRIDSFIVRGTDDKESPEVQNIIAEKRKQLEGNYVLVDKSGRIEGVFPAEEPAIEAAREKVKRDSGEKIGEKGVSVETAERLGIEHRLPGDDVTSERLKETFGFRGVNFGNWMQGDTKAKVNERQLHLNHLFDAFMDLAQLLNLPPKALSLNGMLGIAVGAQGSGKALAHFVPGVNEINVTRTKGAGALAHEWGHALDHYFATMGGLDRNKEPYLSAHVGTVSSKIENGKLVRSPIDLLDVRPEVSAQFQSIVEAMTKRHETDAEYEARIRSEKAIAGRLVAEEIKEIVASIGEAKTGWGTPELIAKVRGLAARIASLDYGEGRVSMGGTEVPAVVAEIADAYKEASGVPLKNVNALGYHADRYRVISGVLESSDGREPRMVPTDYKKASEAADAKKKPYWSTKLEMFARAFDAYVVDSLAEKAAKNSYLSGIEAVEPQGEERKAIGKAFDFLFAELKTKETERGTAIYNIVGKDALSPADTAIYGMAAEGKSAEDILKFIASASRNPFYRQLAKLLMKTGITPSITVGDGKGWKMNAGEGNKYAAGYNPTTNTVSLFRPASAERNMLHELMHAATLKALSGKGMAAAQMKALYQHVKKSGKLKGMYGMSDVDEFIAEAFSNPKFQAMLKQVSAAPVGGKPSSAWDWFVRVVRGILGLKQGADNALSKALEIGVGVMRENMEAATPDTQTGYAGARGSEMQERPSVRAVTGSMAEPAQSKVGAGGKTNAIAISDSVQASAIKAAQKVQDESNAFDLEEEIKSVSENGESDLSSLIANPKYWDAENEEFTDEGYKQVDLMNEQKARDNLRLLSITDLSDLDSAYHKAQYAAMVSILDGMGIEYKDTSSNSSKYLEVGRLKLRFANHANTTRSVMAQVSNMDEVTSLINVAPGEYKFAEALDAVMLENMKATAEAGGTHYAEGQKQTDTTAFRKWFGDSKVVDANGDPLVVYHGTGATDISEFKVSTSGTYGGGIYLTPEIRGANDYAIYRGAPSSTVYPVYAAIKNPASGSEAAQVASWKGEENAREELIKRGYDGVVDMRSGEIVAFYPEQIKSAIGNNGDFDQSNPDIRYNVADEGWSVAEPSNQDIRYNAAPGKINQTDTEAFKRWFGDSAVVDSDGKPLRVFHGTASDITAFDIGRSGESTGNTGFYGAGAYFSEDADYASGFSFWARRSDDQAPNVVPVYLSLKNPAYINITPRSQAASEKSRATAEKIISTMIARGTDQAVVDKLQGFVSENKFEPFMGTLYNALGGGTGTTALLKEAGFDGVTIYGGISGKEKLAEAVAFDPTQIKSAIGNNGDFDQSNPDIRYNVADEGWSVAEPSKMDDVIYALQDKQIDMKRVVQSIMKTGKQIKDDFNAYLQEELFHGRAAKGVKDFLDFELRPLLAEMQKAGIDMGDFEEYLWNRHAPERNAQIAKINPDMPDGGSGIETAKARAYLAGLSVEQRKTFEALAAKVEAMNRESQRVLIESGLEKQSTIDAWNNAYQHYVPLQREDVDSGHVGTGKGFSVRGSSSKRAMGSGRQVVDIIANLTMQRERNIVRAEKNRVSNALLGLAVQNPNPDFWKVDQAPKERVVEETAIYTVRDESGKKLDEFTRMDEAERFARQHPGSDIEQTWGDRVKERVTPGFTSRDNVLLTRINGEDHYVIFNERDERAMRMAMAMKNLDVDNLGRVLSIVGKATRYLASINTQYNPVFGVINLIRDAQGALINLSSTALAGEQKRVLGYTKDALVGIYRDIRAHRAGKKPSSNWAALFEEFQKEGGQTGYRDQYANAEARAEAIKAELEQFKDGKAKQFTRGLFGWLSDYNETMENAVRLAVYAVAKEKGMSKQQAASLAKNVTVNFNRKGQMATQVGALYAFFNASVQGTARIAETLFEQHGGDIKNVRLSKKGKQIVLGGIMLGSMQALLLAAAGYDDDEPPEFVRERNLILPVGDGKYLTLAMPLGLHVIPGIGRIATEFVLSGGKDPLKRIAAFGSMFADAFNPVGSAGWSLQTITPSVVDPFAALAENKDFTGKEIYREDFNKLSPTPGHARAKDVATIWSRFISEILNRATGGTEFKPGMFSPSPDSIDYLIAQAGGGVMREANKVAQTVGATATGEDLPLYKIPLVGRFVGDTAGQSGQSQKFYEAIKQINMHEAQYKGLIKDGRSTEAREYLAENPAVKLIMAGNHAELAVRKLRTMKRDLVENDADQAQIRAIDDRITATMKAFNERAKAAI